MAAVPRPPSLSAVPAAAAPTADPPPKQHFPPAADLPTQLGPEGIRFDFNLGARVHLPESGGPWQVRLSDLDTGNLLYETTIAAGRVSTAKRYYLRIRTEVRAGGQLILSHDYDCRGREVLIQFPVGTLGDTMGWFPYAREVPGAASAAG